MSRWKGINYLRESETILDANLAAQEIIEQIESEEGFLIQIKVYNNFDADALNKLIEAIENYRAILGKSQLIDRKVMYWLFSLFPILESLQHHFDAVSHPNGPKVQTARIELKRVVNRLLEPAD